MCTSINHRFEYLLEKDNIVKAIHEAFMDTNTRQHPDVQEILSDLAYHVSMIKYIIENDLFTIQKHRIRIIWDKCSRKERMIMEPYYLYNSDGNPRYEHIIHHLLIDAIRPYLEKTFIHWTCGSIPNRGSVYGMKHVKKIIRKTPHKVKYCLKVDIKHFYQDIDISILKQKLEKHIHDRRYLDLLFKVLDSNVGTLTHKDGTRETISMGLPIGFYTSQWLANYFLNDYDHYIFDYLKQTTYTRYIDDQVIFSPNKRELHKILKLIKQYLKKEKLELKSNYQIFKFHYIDKYNKEKYRPLDFLGYKFYRNRTTLRKSLLHNIVTKARIINKMTKENTITWKEACSFLSYLGYLKRINTRKYYNKYIAHNISLKYLKDLVRQHIKEISTQRAENIKNGKTIKWSLNNLQVIAY